MALAILAKKQGSIYPFLAWLAIVLVSFLLMANNNLTKRNVLYTAPHADIAPFQRVWNPDTNNDYTEKEFSNDDGDGDDGIVTDEISGEDGKFTGVNVPAFNGEDYFDDKPIGYDMHILFRIQNICFIH